MLPAANISGGAAYLYASGTSNQTTATLLISSNNFSSNTASFGGGLCLVPSHQNITVHNSTFIGNVAFAPPSEGRGSQWEGYVGEGGGLHMSPLGITMGASSNLTLLTSNFTSNFADNSSGGVLANGIDNVQVHACIFSDNWVGLNGYAGGLQLKARCPPKDAALANNSQAYENQLYCEAGISDSLFTNNTVTYSAGGGGAFFALDGYMLHLANTTFSNNKAIGGAAGMYLGAVTWNGAGSIVLMSGMNFSHNTAINSSIAVQTPTLVNVAGLGLEGVLCAAILNSTFDQNIGASYDSYAAVAVRALAGQDCQSATANYNALPQGFAQQPALFNATGTEFQSAFDLRNTVFSNNNGDSIGGLYFLEGNGNSITISDSSFRNNTSAWHGGGITAFHAPPIQLINSHMIDQHALFEGGAISSIATDVILTNSTIQQSLANTSGGAISMAGNTLRVYNSDLSRNTAVAQGGGAVSCKPCTAAIFVNSTFDDNVSQDVGGVFVADTDTLVISMQNVRATGNK